jgi:hypothetical protein
LESVERENKFLKRCVALILVAIGAVFVMAQAQSRPRTLEAEKVIIRYPNGKEAVVLGTKKDTIDEEAVADFYTTGGTTGIAVYTGSIRSSVQVVSPKEERQVFMEANSDYKVLNSTFARSASLGIAPTYGASVSQIRLTIGPDGTGVQLLTTIQGRFALYWATLTCKQFVPEARKRRHRRPLCSSTKQKGAVESTIKGSRFPVRCEHQLTKKS